MSTLDMLTAILHRDYGVARDALSPDATLVTLGLDSLSVLELMFKIEDGFGVKINDDPPNDLRTVSDVVNYIDALLTRKAAGSADRAIGIASIP